MKRLKPSAIILFSVSLLLSSELSYELHQQHVEETAAQFSAAARDRFMALQQSINNSLIIGNSVASLYAASKEVTREEFATFTQFILVNAPYIKALEWAPHVTEQERADYEDAANDGTLPFHFTERDSDGKIIPAKIRDEYFPAYYVQPYKGNEQVYGFDLGSDQIRRQALEFARDNNVSNSTSRISLLQSGEGSWGFLTYIPIYKNGAELNNINQRRALFRGAIVIVYDIPTLVESSLNYLVPIGININLYDDSAPSDKQFLYSHSSRVQASSRNKRTVEEMPVESSGFLFSDRIHVNNRNWLVKMSPLSGYFDTAIKFEVWLVFVGLNLAFISLIAYLQLLRKRELGLIKDKELLENIVSLRTHDLEEKNKELETFSYSIAHDLRSPLRAISGFSQILQEDASSKLDCEQKDYLQRIVSACMHMADLIDDILELSRVTSGELVCQDVDISAIANSIVERLKKMVNGKIAHWKIQDNIKVKGDAQLLTLLMVNLLTNALKFSAGNPHPLIEFGVQTIDKQKTYFVRDNGIGFSMDYAEKIFGVFQRLHPNTEFEGTGIGLATVKRIITRHNGKVWAEAQESKGATFYFTLPDE